MSTTYIRDEAMAEGLFKRLAARLPLSLRRHLFYLRDTGKWGNFRNPRTFGEKMQWRIINDQRRRLTYASDRLAARDLVAKAVSGSQHTLHFPELLAYSETPETFIAVLRKLDRAGSLPSRWVVKPNNSSGQVLETNGEPDWRIIEQSVRRWQSSNRFKSLHWIPGYDRAREGFIAEAWVGPRDESPLQWECTVIQGSIVFYALTRRINGIKERECRDANWSLQPSWFHSSSSPIGLDTPPQHKNEIDEIAKLVAQDWDFVRVDLYYAASKVWFGEITPYPFEGLVRTTVGGRIYDDRCGQLWTLPPITKVGRDAT